MEISHPVQHLARHARLYIGKRNAAVVACKIMPSFSIACDMANGFLYAYVNASGCAQADVLTHSLNPSYVAPLNNVT